VTSYHFSEGPTVSSRPREKNPLRKTHLPPRLDAPLETKQPNKITVAKGETVEFVNNKAFPHNVVFDEDNVPAGVNADAISHEDYLNGPGEKVTNTFDTPGTYGYYCEPHQGAGMQGTIIVQ
jgi:plastocyanin